MLATSCGGARIFTDPQALILDDEVQADEPSGFALIATPDTTHAALTTACIEAGKPVLCEKPLATNQDEAWGVIEAEVAAGRRLVQVGFMREFDPPHKDLKLLLDQGELGKLLLFKGLHANLDRGPRDIEDVITNSLIHDIHSTRWIMGQEAQEVYVQWVPAQPERPNTCRLLITQMALTDGALAMLEVNADSGYGYEVMVSVVGELGTGQTAKPVGSTSLPSPTLCLAGNQTRMIDQTWLTRFETAYLLEAQAWVNALLNEAPIGPTAWDGYMSLVIADACKCAAQTGSPEAVPQIERPSLY